MHVYIVFKYHYNCNDNSYFDSYRETFSNWQAAKDYINLKTNETELYDEEHFFMKEVFVKDFVKQKTHFENYQETLRPKILPLYAHLSSEEGIEHGINHIDEVVKNIITIAEIECPELLMECIYAAALHDCGRINNAWCDKHEKLGLPITEKFLKEDDLLWPASTIKDILYAIGNHTSGTGGKANNMIAACLWDADRIRLAKMYGYDEFYFSTDTGKKLAQQK